MVAWGYMNKRKVLTYFLVLFSGVGIGLTVYPFIASLSPDEGLRKGIMEYDISGLEPGEYKLKEWDIY